MGFPASGGGSSAAGFKIGYDQITTGSVNVASTTESAGTTVITGSAYTFDGSLVRCEFYSPLVRAGTNASQVIVCLFEGSTQICRLGLLSSPGTAVAGQAMLCAFYFTPTAGSHSYKVTAFATDTTGTPIIGSGAGGTATGGPAYLAFFKA